MLLKKLQQLFLGQRLIVNILRKQQRFPDVYIFRERFAPWNLRTKFVNLVASGKLPIDIAALGDCVVQRTGDRWVRQGVDKLFRVGLAATGDEIVEDFRQFKIESEKRLHGNDQLVLPGAEIEGGRRRRGAGWGIEDAIEHLVDSGTQEI